MKRLRLARMHVTSAVLLTMVAATTAFAADQGTASPSIKRQLAAEFQRRLSESLLVLVPSEEIEAKAPQTAKTRGGQNAFDDQQVPRSSLVAALLASNSYGLGSGSAFAAAEAAAVNGASQHGGRRPVSPNGPPGPLDPPGPPDRPPGPPHDPPGPPDDPPGPPDGKGPKAK